MALEKKQMKVKNSYVLILLGLVLVINANAQEQFGELKGLVYNEEGVPLFSANVAILNEQYGTVTDELGRFEIDIPANRTLELIISYIGYQPDTILLNLKPGDIKKATIKLFPVSKTLEEVMVISKYDRTNTLMRIDLKPLEFIPSPSGSFEALLKTLPGVSSSNELSSQYSVRGGNFDENLVYVNDIEIHRPFLIRSGEQEGLSFINSDLISSIQFSAGGFDTQYGDKMSSVLDIKYKRPYSFGGGFTASMLGGAVHLEGLSRNKKLTYIGGLRYKSSKYLLNSLQTQGDYKPSFIDFQTFITYDITKKLEFSLLGNFSSNQFQIIPEQRETSFGTYQQTLNFIIFYEGQEIDHFYTYLGAFTLDFRPISQLSLKLIGSGFTSEEEVTYDILGQYRIDQLDNVIGRKTYGDSIANIGVGTYMEHARNYLSAVVYSIAHKGSYYTNNNNIKWGIKYQIEDIEDKISEWMMIDSAGYSIPYSTSQVNLYEVIKSKNALYSHRLSGYFQNTFSMDRSWAKLFLTTGIRANYWTVNKQLIVSPRAVLSIEPYWTSKLKFHLATGFYSQPPFYKELRDPEGNLYLNLKAQKSIHYVLGSEYQFTAMSRPFIFTTEVFYKDIVNLIPYKYDDVRIQYLPEYKARGYAAGIEFKINGEFVIGAESWASLSIMQTKEDIYRDFYLTAERKVVKPGFYRRPTDQWVNFGMYFQDYFPNNPEYKFHVTFLYGSNLPYGTPDYDRPDINFKMKPYHRVDIGLSKSLLTAKIRDNRIFRHLKSFWFSAELLNAFGVENQVSYDWIRTVENSYSSANLFGVPNYLTGRRINIKIQASF